MEIRGGGGVDHMQGSRGGNSSSRGNETSRAFYLSSVDARQIISGFENIRVRIISDKSICDA